MMEPATQLLADLVAIPSMNPMGRDREGIRYCEEGIASFVAAYLRARGVDVEVYEVSPHRPNVVGFIDVHAPRTILLEAHLDTVHTDNMAIEPFRPDIVDGRLYGRGACDTKGALAAFLYGACSLLATGHTLRWNVLLAGIADEEYRFTGAQTAVARGLKADCGIAGEPTQLRIVHAHKGVTRWKIVTRGKAAHSAYPTRGDNAIYTMAQVVARLEDYALEIMHDPPHPLLGTPTLSVGVIEGGQAVNIVPDSCWIEVDRRTLPGETIQSVLRPVRDLLREVPEWHFEEPHLSVAGMEVGVDTDLVRRLAGAVRVVTGSVTMEAAHYATDAGVYNAAGIPTVVFGPGDIAQAHTDSEYIELRQFSQAVETVKRLLT